MEEGGGLWAKGRTGLVTDAHQDAAEALRLRHAVERDACALPGPARAHTSARARAHHAMRAGALAQAAAAADAAEA